MEQHPIPQQITSYQFRLVGDMTLKQFFELAGGVVVGLIFYSTPLHPLIKWPLIFFFTLLGVALAFLPFEDRPLEDWILAFFRSIYAPTIYGWRKQPAAKFFKDEAPGAATVTASDDAQSPVFAKKLDSFEKNFLSGISSLFGGTGPMPPTQPTPETGAPTTLPQVSTDTISPLAGKGLSATEGAQFSYAASPPAPPSLPNTIVGQVLDATGRILESVILEVRDASGRPVRALRTNKLGHFMVVTPLVSGPYELVAEKEGYEFDAVRFDALGELIPPIVINAEPGQSGQSTINNQPLTIAQ